MNTTASSWKFQKLWTVAVAIHVALFLFMVDIYFRSPIQHGMAPHGTDRPFAKRIVLFVADGLRAEAMFTSDNEARTPYLTSLIKSKRASWGIATTRVPTESRPGHAAILGGIYEDPSAIFTGWTANIVEFDTVINRSNRAWAYGSPDIVKIFPKADKQNYYVNYYSRDIEDFSGNTSMQLLDNWTFSEFRTTLKLDGSTCGSELIDIRTRLFRIEDEEAEIQLKKDVCTTVKCECDKSEPLCSLECQSCGERANVEQAPLRAEWIELEDALQANSLRCDGQRSKCGRLCESGNLFFLHLLGMDSVGHVHKPDSRAYNETLRAVDKGIETTTALVEEYFGDNETVYLFTSDHGMTNWGSHGDGSDHETEVPFIVWGKGIKSGQHLDQVNQADLAPLIASLIGIPVPINSEGIVPYRLLSGNENDICKAVFANTHQLAERYFVLRAELAKDRLFKDHFADTKIFDAVGRSCQNVTKEHINDLVAISAEILVAIKYLHGYYYWPKILSVSTGFVLWMCYLAFSLNSSSKRNEDNQFRKPLILQSVVIVSAACAALYMLVIRSSMVAYLYLVFPVAVVLCVLESGLLKHITILLAQKRLLFVAGHSIKFLAMIELLVYGFFEKMSCCVIMILLGLWLISWKDLNWRTKTSWILVCLLTTSFLMLPGSTKFNYNGFYAGVTIWMSYCLVYVAPCVIKFQKMHHVSNTKNAIWTATTPLVIFVLAATIHFLVAVSFDRGQGVKMHFKIASWLLSGLSFVMIPLSPLVVNMRFNHICTCLLIPLLLMSVHFDLVFYTMMVAALHYWIRIETEIYNKSLSPDSEMFKYHVHSDRENVQYEDYRRTFFYMALTICYFFAIGNVAKFSGFDPLWTRTYVSTFSPFVMTTLIVLKICIPFLITSCAFFAVNSMTRTDTVTVFSIVMLFLDVMVLNFAFLIRNEGSWKEIGTSLSLYIVVSAMVLVVIIFYMLARFVTTATVFAWTVNKEPKENGVAQAESHKVSVEGDTVRRRYVSDEFEQRFHDIGRLKNFSAVLPDSSRRRKYI